MTLCSGDARLNVSLSGSSGQPIAPGEFALFQNYPNPFNPTTRISFNLPVASRVKLEVYNIRGQTVATLVDDYRQAGKYEVEWNASNTASGVYFYRITAGEYTDIKRLLLLK